MDQLRRCNLVVRHAAKNVGPICREILEISSPQFIADRESEGAPRVAKERRNRNPRSGAVLFSHEVN